MIPLPNNRIEVTNTKKLSTYNATVIASVMYREADDELPNNRYTLLLLVDEPPYYRVVVVEDTNDGLMIEMEQEHRNIVPAVNGVPKNYWDSAGYTDMGGDY